MSNIPINKIPSSLPVANRIGKGKNTITGGSIPNAGVPFHEILKEKQADIRGEELKFSKHANERLTSRNIDLTDEQYRRLQIGAHKASLKGIRESLVLVDDLAFIVNIKNNTVITAVNDGKKNFY